MTTTAVNQYAARMTYRRQMRAALGCCWIFFLSCLFQLIFSGDFSFILFKEDYLLDNSLSGQENMPRLSALFNSDSLSNLLLFDALTSGTLDGWHSSPSQFWFPHATVYAFFHFLTNSDIGWAQVLTAHTWGVIGVYGWILLARNIRPGCLVAPCLVLASAGLIYLVSTDFFPNELLVQPVHRADNYAILPYFLVWFYQRRWSPPTLAAAAICLILIVTSDPLFLLWLCFPCGLYCLFFRRRDLPTAAGFIAVVVLGAYIARQTAASFTGGFELGDGYVSTTIPLASTINSLLSLAGNNNATSTALPTDIMFNYVKTWAIRHPTSFLSWAGAILTIGAACFHRRPKTKQTARLLALVLFSGLMPVFIVSSFTTRYMLPLWFAPLFIAPVFLIALRKRRLLPPAVPVLIIVASLAAALSVGFPTNHDIKKTTDFYPQEFACIDEQIKKHRLKKGLTAYWESLPMEYFLKNKARFVTVTNELEFYLWNNNFYRYLGDDFNFILGKTDYPLSLPFYILPMEDMDFFVGTPAIAEFTCGSFVGKVYPPFSYSERLCRLARRSDGLYLSQAMAAFCVRAARAAPVN